MPATTMPKDTALPEAARTVELPVCMRCGLVGKKPGGGSATFKCTGPRGAPHKSTVMTMVLYEAKRRA